MPTCTIDGCSIYYEITGDGPPLLMIPGHTRGYLYWRPQVEKLREHFTVITFDPRGIGKSVCKPGDRSIIRFTQDIVALLKHAGHPRAHIFSYSFGALVGLYLAAHHPEVVNKLIISGGTSHTDALLKHRVQTWIDMFEAGLDKKWYQAFTTSVSVSANHLQQPKKSQQFTRFLYSQLPQPSKHETLAQFKSILDFDARLYLKDIMATTLIMVGEYDFHTAVYHAEELANSIRNSRLKIFKKTGHSTHTEAPKLFLKTVIEFLEGSI